MYTNVYIMPYHLFKSIRFVGFAQTLILTDCSITISIRIHSLILSRLNVIILEEGGVTDDPRTYIYIKVTRLSGFVIVQM